MNKKLTITVFLVVTTLFNLTLIAQNQVDDMGRKQGSWTKKDEKGRIVYKGNFKNDIPVDTFYYYNKKGELDMKSFYSNQGKNVYTQFFHTNGKLKAEGNYIEKQKQGTWIYYSEKGVKISEENYINNLKDGIEKKWDNLGKNIIQSTTYKQGKKNGEYYQSLYKQGYYTANYKDDKLDGDYNEFYPSNTLKVKGQYINGDKQGTWEIKDSYGNTIQQLFYENDVLIGDKIRFNVQSGIKDIAQKDIAIIRQAGKQTQIILFNGDRINCFNSIDGVIALTDANIFMRINEKNNIYINIDNLKGINKDGSVATKIEAGFVIMPDKDGIQLLNTLFSKD